MPLTNEGPGPVEWGEEEEARVGGDLQNRTVEEMDHRHTHSLAQEIIDSDPTIIIGLDTTMWDSWVRLGDTSPLHNLSS